MNNEAHINQGVDMYGRQKPDLLSPRECAIIAAQAADEKKATDIMVQQVGDLIGVTEYFVICTASNNRQVDAVVDEIEEQCRLRGGAKPYHIEGTADGTWSLLDYGSFIVHVFQPETRDYYRLESLWNDAPLVDLEGEAGLTDLTYSERIAKLVGREAQRTIARNRSRRRRCRWQMPARRKACGHRCIRISNLL